MTCGKLLMMGLLQLFFTACAAGGVDVQRSQNDYPFSHGAFDLRVGWKTAPAGEETLVEGKVQNVRYVQVRDMEVTVLLLSGQRQEIAKGRSFTSPNRIDESETAEFKLRLTGLPRPGDLLHFLIQYHAIEDSANEFNWISSFTVNALSGKPQENP
jgi:hypothetical protein